MMKNILAKYCVIGHYIVNIIKLLFQKKVQMNIHKDLSMALENKMNSLTKMEDDTFFLLTFKLFNLEHLRRELKVVKWKERKERKKRKLSLPFLNIGSVQVLCLTTRRGH